MDATTKPGYRPKADILQRMGLDEFPDYKALIAKAFKAYDPDYPEKTKKTLKQYRKARAAVQREEKKLNQHRSVDDKIRLSCSRHIRIEAKWYQEETADFDGFEDAIERLYGSLNNHDQPQDIAWQDPANGAFGCGYTRFHLQCDAMIEAVYDLYNDGQSRPPQYPLEFLAPIATPEKLKAYLTPLRSSDIASTGLNHRDQIGAITGSMSQLVYKSYLRDYVRGNVKGFDLSDEYIAAYTTFIDEWQDPATGFWGEWFTFDGKLHKTPDLSLTYHTVKYRKGKIQHWDALIDTLFAIKDCEYPFGWKVNGNFNNHNSMDVVKIFKLGWDKMSAQQKGHAREDMHEMLDWCLNDSLEPDGSFRFFPFYNSWGDAFYYGVAFLDAVGYLNPDNRFWTDEPFPGWQDTGCRIKKKLRSLGLNNRRAQAAMDILNKDVPDC